MRHSPSIASPDDSRCRIHLQYVPGQVDTDDPTKNRFYLVVVQYAARLSPQKMSAAMLRLKPSGARGSRARCNLQVAPEEVHAVNRPRLYPGCIMLCCVWKLAKIVRVERIFYCSTNLFLCSLLVFFSCHIFLISYVEGFIDFLGAFFGGEGIATIPWPGLVCVFTLRFSAVKHTI